MQRAHLHTTVPRSPVLMTDLVPRWRKAWRDLPRAKLWCEPWNRSKRDSPVDLL